MSRSSALSVEPSRVDPTNRGPARSVARHRTRLNRSWAGTVIVHFFGVLVSALCALPVLIVLVISLEQGTFASLSSPRGWTLANYRLLLTGAQLPRWVFNSLLVAAAVTFLTLIIDLMAGFAFAKLKFRGRSLLFVLMISTLMLPFSITLVPTYLLVARYGLVNTYPGLILPMLSGPIGVFLMRQFIRGIPDALLEAATIDGASMGRIFLQIVVPLCVQPMAVLSVFTFVGAWNAFLWPLLVTQTDQMKTLTVGIATTNLQFHQNVGNICAQAILSLVPMLILYIAFQRYFVKGITAGAFKG